MMVIYRYEMMAIGSEGKICSGKMVRSETDDGEKIKRFR